VDRSHTLRYLAQAALALTAALLTLPGTAAARTDLTATYELKRCPGTIHAGFTAEERRPAVHYGRHKRISCRRARAIVRRVDGSEGGYPTGYGWSTPHGSPSSWPTVFHHVLMAAYLAYDGHGGSRSNPGVAVVTFA
jgi:hypothetical protein